jgi:hypothetical protein
MNRLQPADRIEMHNLSGEVRTYMKIPALLFLVCFLAAPAAAFTTPPLPTSYRPAGSDLVPVASFEGGYRYQAGSYPVIVLTGSYREMGRQYGALMKKELTGEYDFVVSNISHRGYTLEQIRAMGRESAPLYPVRLKEVFRGMAETTGLSEDDILVLWNGPLLYISLQPPAQTSCSYLAAWGNYTPDGTVIVSRNWDLPDAVEPFNAYYVLAVYRPTDGSNGIATFGPAGTRPETYMNSKGLFIADDNAGIEDNAPDIRPDLVSEFFRLMLDYSDAAGLDAGIRGARPNVGWIVDTGSPEGASVYEVATNTTRQRSGPGVVAAANHFADPAWGFAPPPEHSATRYDGLLRLAGAAKGSIDTSRMMQIRDVRVEDGGARFVHSDLGGMSYSTNHQVVFVPKTLTLWVRIIDRDWQKVELAPLFGNTG